MQSRPNNGTNQIQHIGLARKILFGAFCLISFICVCLLISFKNKSVNALNGELLSGQAQGTVVQSSQESFFSVVFDYFGNVTYLFPLVLVYVGYKVAMKRISLKDIDFFVLGTFILGFNLLILGFCALFSALFGGIEIGAGGILGDFFTIYLSRYFPAQIATILPILLVFVGILLFTAKSPLWYCDKIGEITQNLFARILGRKVEEKTVSEEASKKEEPEITTGSMSVFDTVVNKPADKDEGKKDSARMRSEIGAPYGVFSPSESTPFSSSTNKSSQGRKSPSFMPREMPKFGEDVSMPPFGDSGHADYSKKRPAPEKRTAFSGFKLSRKDTQPHERHERIEPQLESFGISGQGRYESQSAAFGSAALSDSASSADNSSSGASDSPATYISGAAFSSNMATAPDYRRFQDDSSDDSASSGSSTIINGAGARQGASGTRDMVQKTIISRMDTSRSSQEAQSSKYAEKEYASSDTSLNEQDKTSTIIYKAGADHLPPTQCVGSPMRKSEVSTVITRTTSVPAKNAQKDVNYSTDTSAIKGDFSEKSEGTQTDSMKNGSSLESTPSSKQVFTSPEDKDENIINFSDFSDPSIPQLNKNSGITVSSLSPSFVPSEGLKKDKEDDGKLQKVENQPIKESDVSFEKYSKGSRGVGLGNEESSTPSEDFADDNAPDPRSFAGANLADVKPVSEPEVQKTLSDIKISESEERIVMPETAVSEPAVSSSTDSSEQSTADNYSHDSFDRQKIPFEGMSSINGAVPYEHDEKPERAPVGSIPTVTYAVATETTPKRDYGTWRPPLSLLARSNQDSFSSDEEILRKIAAIDKFMVDFNAKAKVADYVSGPVITRFDMALEPGVKSSSIANLGTDLQRNLMTNKINMIAAVPGTPYMGIEVPNEKRQLITLGDVVTSDVFLGSKAYLPMCLGVDTVGRPVVADLASAPHLLIAGTTGSGKSAGLNSMLVSLLLARSPAELRLIMVDPKTVEFSQYQGLPHLLTPIITDPESTAAALAWLIKEQERRYKLISLMNVSNIHQVNALIRSENAQGRVVYDPVWTPDMGGEAPILKPVPYIMLVIDEFADLIAVTVGGKKGSSIDQMIGRLAAKARAAGIHLILATQTPRAEIVTGPIRANMPSRIAYTVQNSQESRIILDENGAENLLGNGDMMVKYQKLNNTQLFRAHGPYASNDDVKNVVNAWIENAGEPEYVEGVTEFVDEEEAQEAVADAGKEAGALDSKFDAIVDWIRTELAASTKPLSISEIQTTHSVGYNRAKRIHRQLQQEGIIDAKGNIL